MVTRLQRPETAMAYRPAWVGATAARVSAALVSPLNGVPFKIHWKVNGPVPAGVALNTAVSPGHRTRLVSGATRVVVWTARVALFVA